MTVLKKIEKNIDSCGSAELENLSKEIAEKQQEIEKYLTNIKEEEDALKSDSAEERNISLELATYEDIEKLQEEWERNKRNKEEYERQKLNQQQLYMKNFKNCFSQFSLKPLMTKCDGILSKDDLADKGVPDICNTTLDFLIKRDVCICGKKFSENPECLAEIRKLYEYVPPKSAGTMIREMIDVINGEIKKEDSFFDNMNHYIESIDELSEKIDKEEIKNQLIDKNMLTHGDEIKRLKENQKALIEKNQQHRNKIDLYNQELGRLTSDKDVLISSRERMINANESSKRWKRYRAYVEAIYENVVNDYNKYEKEKKEVFDKCIDDILKDIYQDEIKISVDDRYRVKVMSGLELSTSQYYSIVLAFIATTLKMARDRKPNTTSVMDYPEDYPLVMDAPLSAFDKIRIRKICSILPKIAEQVIIFIKDTDGDLAEQYMYDSIGKRYEIIKNAEAGIDSSVKEVR